MINERYTITQGVGCWEVRDHGPGGTNQAGALLSTHGTRALAEAQRARTIAADRRRAHVGEPPTPFTVATRRTDSPERYAGIVMRSLVVAALGEALERPHPATRQWPMARGVLRATVTADMSRCAVTWTWEPRPDSGDAGPVRVVPPEEARRLLAEAHEELRAGRRGGREPG